MLIQSISLVYNISFKFGCRFYDNNNNYNSEAKIPTTSKLDYILRAGRMCIFGSSEPKAGRVRTPYIPLLQTQAGKVHAERLQ